MDEMIAQLLVSEGFRPWKKSPTSSWMNSPSSTGFDEGTALRSLQARADATILDRDQAAAKPIEKRPRARACRTTWSAFEGLTPQMLVEASAEGRRQDLEDFAGCADWELTGGWIRRVDGEGGARTTAF